MTKSLHWLLAISIPALIVIIFHLVYSNITVSNTEKVCTYVSSNTCVKESVAEGTIKNIDLKKYDKNYSSYKVGEKVIYETISSQQKRFDVMLLVYILSFILIFFIRFPALWHIFIIET